MSQDEPTLPTELPEFNAREFARRWRDVWQDDEERLEKLGAKQKAVIETASEAWLRALVAELAAKVLWGFLTPKAKSDFNSLRVEARQVVLRGFQQTQSIVRHPTVQNRLVAWLEKHREVAHVLLLLWEQGAREVVRALDEDADEAALIRVLRKYGPLSSWVGAGYLGSEKLFSETQRLLSHPAVWSVQEEAEETPSTNEGGEAREELEAATDWKEQAQQLQETLAVREREIKLLTEENAELAALRERLRASQRELDKARKEEKARETAWAKKLELAQTATQKELAEVKKHDERETRRLHAAEKERDELDSTVKVLRKQVRHLNQLLDEQQKKNASLEARLAQREKDETKATKDEQAVDAVSTPKTTQKSANAPVKVAKPTPLDELFRWVADGHEFRATPREAMRHIDRGDEDFVFRAQLALEGVGAQDVAKKNAFLTRLKEQDGYYVRVLTEPTQRALVDASNVVRATKNRYGKGELRNLRAMRTELRRLGFFPIEMIADASLRYNVDEINAYNEMVNRGEVEVVTPGMEADEVLVRKVRSGGGYVITNDGKFHFKVSPDMAPPSISFRVTPGLVVIDEF